MASAMEQYVNSVRTLSSQGNYAQLFELITKSHEALTKNLQHLDDVLGTLDMQQHSLGVLGILCVKHANTIADFETLFVQTQEFVTQCNGEQIRYACDIFADLCHRFTKNLTEKKEYIRGLNVLKVAITKVQLFPSQLTSIHVDLCQLCLLAKCFKPAQEFLDVDVTDISKENGAYDAKHFLLYYYYGGMIYAALKNYARAFYFFEVAVTMPSMAVSHIMLEAYKKFILLALMLHGKIPSLPKYTSQVVSRYIKPLCQPYHDLATAYTQNNPTDLGNIVTRHTEVYTRDNNMGLVKQCVSSLYRKMIQRLTKTFLTLSLTDMANRVHLPSANEAEKYVLSMIEDVEIFATINQKDGMVRFHDNPEKYNTMLNLVDVDKQMQFCMQLHDKLQEMDRDVSTNPQFVKKSTGANDDDVPGSSGHKFPSASYSMSREVVD